MTTSRNQEVQSMDNIDIEAVKESLKAGIIYFIQQEQDVKRLKWIYEMLGYYNQQNQQKRKNNELH